MTQQDKDLLLHDLSARLPYGVYVYANGMGCYKLSSIALYKGNAIIEINEERLSYYLYEIKPYLRSLSSLTQEERNKFCDIGGVISYRPSDGKQYIVAYIPEALDYLNSIHADYRGLIEKGLAIEVTEENNPYK